MHPANTLKTLAIATLLSAIALPTLAADATRLGLVWARVADFKGEFGSVESAEFSPDGRYVVAATKFDFQVVKFRVSDGTEMWRFNARDEIEHAQFSPDGKYIVASGEDATTRVYNADTAEEVAAYFHDQSVDSVTWSPDGRYIFAGEEDYEEGDNYRGYGRVLSWPGLELVTTTDNGFTHNGVAFHPEGHQLATTMRDGIYIWDVKKKFKRMKKLTTRNDEGKRLPPISVNWSSDGRYLVAGTNNGTIYLWDATDFEVVRIMAQTGVKIETVDFSPDGRYLVHAGHTPDIWMWNLAEVADTDIPNERLTPAHRAFANANAEDLNFTPDGFWMVSAHQDGVVRLWVVMNDDPDTATKANAVLLENQAKKNWGELNRKAREQKNSRP